MKKVIFQLLKLKYRKNILNISEYERYYVALARNKKIIMSKSIQFLDKAIQHNIDTKYI